MPIEQVRNLLLIALFAVSFLIWQTWQQDYAPKPPQPPPSQQTSETPAGPAPGPAVAPTEAAGASQDLPPAPGGPPAPAASASAPAPAAASSGETVRVTTDTVVAEIDLAGGTISRLELLDYPVAVDAPDEPLNLMSSSLPDLFTAESGLKGIGESQAPGHATAYSANARAYALEEGRDRLEVPLRWSGADGGLSVEKVLVFTRGSYLVEIEYRIRNDGATPWQGSVYGQFQRTQVAQEGGLFRTYTYTGGVFSTEEKPYEKYGFDDMYDVDLLRDTRGGWVSMIQHYFAGAFVPDQSATNRIYSRVDKMAPGGPRYTIGVITPNQTIAPGAGGTLSLKLYAGPKIQERLEPVAPNLERTVDYGWLWFIAEPLFWLLDKIHSFLGNWGWSIIVLTLLIKLAFFQLSAASYKSMARMRKMQPRITQIRERHGDDRQRMNQAMMELYKTEKINPLGGCLPIVVQIPVFIALYWVLLESVELRQAPFMLWIKDLAVYDPYFVFPLAMGATMFVQQKLNPAPPDPMQAKIMMALPIVFTFLFLFFPAGLTIYWFVNNLLSIAQQWIITKKIVGPQPAAA